MAQVRLGGLTATENTQGSRVARRIGRTVTVLIFLLVGVLGVWFRYHLADLPRDWSQIDAKYPGMLIVGVLIVGAFFALSRIWLYPLRRPPRQVDGSSVFAESAGGRLWSTFFACLVLFAFGIAAADAGPNWFALGIVVLFIGFLAYGLIQPPQPVTIGVKGIAGADGRRPMIAWDEIRSVELIDLDDTPRIEIRLSPAPEPAASNTVQRWRWRRAAPRVVRIAPSQLGADADVMLDAIQEFQDRHSAAGSRQDLRQG